MPKRHDKITKSVNYDYYWDIFVLHCPAFGGQLFFITGRARC